MSAVIFAGKFLEKLVSYNIKERSKAMPDVHSKMSVLLPIIQMHTTVYTLLATRILL